MQRAMRRALACALPLALLDAVSPGCASPDLTRTLFSCTTSTDCAPGQQCVAFQGELACQFASRPPGDECTTSNCDVPARVTSNEPLLPATPVESPGIEEAPRLDAPLANPNQAGGDGSLDPAVPGSTPADDAPADDASDHPLDEARADAGAPPEMPTIRFDFESSLEGWRMALQQWPVDTLDTVEQSTALAHHGTGALRMVLDGNYTPTPIPAFGGFAPEPFYGIFQVVPPPPGVEVSLWMFATAPGLSVEVYTLSGAAFTTTVLATVPLLPGEWRQITVAMPLAQAAQLGIQLHSPLDFAGQVYLDEISW